MLESFCPSSSSSSIPQTVFLVMGRYCRVCGRNRPHEHFGGRGQRAIICKSCRRLPRERRMRALWLNEIYGFLEQSNVSKKNLRRLHRESSEISTLSSPGNNTVTNNLFPSTPAPATHSVGATNHFDANRQLVPTRNVSAHDADHRVAPPLQCTASH